MRNGTKPRNRSKYPLRISTQFEPKLLEEADGRRWLVRKLRQRLKKMIADTGADSVQKKLLCQRAVFIGLRLETIEAAAAEGKSVDFGSYTQMTNTFVGLCRILGLKKQLANDGSLQDYIEGGRRNGKKRK